MTRGEVSLRMGFVSVGGRNGCGRCKGRAGGELSRMPAKEPEAQPSFTSVMPPLLTTAAAVLIVAGGFLALIRRGMRWGSTPEERKARMRGDGYTDGGASARVAMTRAVSIGAAPEIVWPWLAQMGRGAGWYSFDCLDNRARTSARHIVSWIPAPAIGDASPIGYLRDIDPGHAMVWWLPGGRFCGATVCLTVDIQLCAEEEGSRLVIRMSGDAVGWAAHLALGVFAVIDSIMACRQLAGIRNRVEAFGARTSDHECPETGDRDQFQRYEVIYATGERAGVCGVEHAERWRRAAEDAGVVTA